MYKRIERSDVVIHLYGIDREEVIKRLINEDNVYIRETKYLYVPVYIKTNSFSLAYNAIYAFFFIRKYFSDVNSLRVMRLTKNLHKPTSLLFNSNTYRRLVASL
ncbi:MAG: hypothetical protein QXL51_07415 [Candidatus Aenigmatarchaeota archaeon]